MKLPKLFCLAVLVTVGTFRAGAQTAAPPAPTPTPAPTPRPSPPPPPFVNVAPDFSAWTITRYTVPGVGSQPADAVLAGAAKATKPESLSSVTKTGRVRHQSRKLKTGEQVDIWFENSNRIMMESMWKIPVFQGDTSGPKSPVGPDFPELSWIAAENYAGTQGDQSVTYLVFETQVTEGNAALAKAYGYTLNSSFHRAYINADTRLPWLQQTGDVLERYAFQTAPTTPLDVPPEYQAMFDAYEKRKINAARKPIAP